MRVIAKVFRCNLNLFFQSEIQHCDLFIRTVIVYCGISCFWHLTELSIYTSRMWISIIPVFQWNKFEFCFFNDIMFRSNIIVCSTVGSILFSRIYLKNKPIHEFNWCMYYLCDIKQSKFKPNVHGNVKCWYNEK